MLLELSAVFDTNDHSTPFSFFKLGLELGALFSSHLTDHYQSIKMVLLCLNSLGYYLVFPKVLFGVFAVFPVHYSP